MATYSSLVNVLDFVTTLVPVVFLSFIAAMMNESNKFAGIIPDDTKKLLKDEADCYVSWCNEGPGCLSGTKTGVWFIWLCWRLFSIDTVSPLKPLISIVFLLTGEMPHFSNPLLTNATVIDSHGCLKVLVKCLLQQFILQQSILVLLISSSVSVCWSPSLQGDIWQHQVIGTHVWCEMLGRTSVHYSHVIASIVKCDPWPSNTSSFGIGICLVWKINKSIDERIK